MRITFSFLIFVTMSVAAAQVDDVTHLTADKVSAAFVTAATLVDTPEFAVIAARRDKGGEAEVHTGETDVFYVVDGSAEFVTGGAVIDPKQTAPGQIRGSGIRDGVVRTLKKGDVIVIPAKTPHWFRDVRGEFLYFVVKPR
jgi:mannose-6-phosphate isomerase-like protein (cupin superfamily)